MTIALSFGAYGGFYFQHGKVSTRLCLGFFAITLFYRDIDLILSDLIEKSKAGQ